MNLMLRIDERLIHGQIAYSWTIEYKIDRIMVVDDVVAKDQLYRMTLGMAVPAGKKLSIFETEQAIQFFIDNAKSQERIFIVVKSPKTVLDLVKAGVPIQSVNVGGMYFKADKQKLTKAVYVSDEDKQIFRQLINLGVEVEIRTAPKDKKINLDQLI